MQFLELQDLAKKYDGQNVAIEHINLTISKGERVAIVGETGSGKTTLLKSIGGLEELDRGSVFFLGDRVKGPKEVLIAGHKKMGFLSQHFDLPKFITVREHLNHPDLEEDELERIFNSCQVVHLVDRTTTALSGGEKQRVALAKLLTHSPELLLLDEPFSNLDQLHKRTMKWMLDRIAQEMSISMIMVSHDPIDVLSWASRVLVMRKGSVIQEGGPEEVYAHPTNEYVAGLFGLYCVINGINWGLSDGSQIVRPEQFIVSSKNEGNASTIVRKGYQGSFELLELQTEQGEHILIRESLKRFRVGDKLNVALTHTS